jgi:hypothetical protein
MLDTRLSNDSTLRCEALVDRVAATAMGPNAHALRVTLAECDALERTATDPFTICRLRDARHWLRLAFGKTLHGYPPDALRRNVLQALNNLAVASRT